MVRSRGILRLTALVALLLPRVAAAGDATPAAAKLTLADVIALAAANNENVLMAEERVAQAENARLRARAALIPVLTAGGAFTHNDKEIAFNNRVIQRQDTFSGGVSLGVTLFDGPAVPALKGAGIRADAARARVAWDRNLVSFETARAYYAVLAAGKLVAAAEQTRETAAEILTAVKTRRAAGEAIGVDQTRAEIEGVSAKEAWVRARNAEDKAMDYLAFLIDRPPPLDLAEAAVHPAPDRDRAGLIEDAWRHRLDLRAAEQSEAASDGDVTGAWMGYLPSLRASGNYRVSQNTGWSGDPDSWDIVVSLDWIIYDGGLRRAERRDRESARRTARLRTRLLKREIRQEVRQALRELGTADATLETVREKERLARLNHEAVRARYQAGLATSLEVVQANDDLVQARTSAVVEALNLALRRLDLLKSLGLDPLGKEVAPL